MLHNSWPFQVQEALCTQSFRCLVCLGLQALLPNEAPAGPAAAALPSLASLPAAQAVALTGLASAQASAVQLPVQTGLAKGGEEAGMNSSAGEKRKSLEEFEQEAFEKLEKKEGRQEADPKDRGEARCHEATMCCTGTAEEKKRFCGHFVRTASCLFIQ